MNLEQAITKLRIMLGEGKTITETTGTNEIQLAEAELVDGTKVQTEGELEVGKLLSVVSADGSLTPAPQGTHETTTGLLVSVDEAGVITSIEPKVEEELKNENTQFSDDFLQQISSLIEPLNNSISSLNEQLKTLKGEFQQFREEPAGKKITNNIVENKQQIDSMYQAKFDKIYAMRTKR